MARGSCEICEDSSQYSWRLLEVEQKVRGLYALLIATALSSFGTLCGVIVILLTK